MAIFMQKYILIIAARIYQGVQGHMLAPPPRKLGKCSTVWCVLVYILIRISLKKVPLFFIKNINCSYSPRYTLALG